MKIDPYEFWKNVDIARGKTTLLELSKQTGQKYDSIKEQRSDLRLPRLEDAYNISKALGTTIDVLIEGTDLSEETRLSNAIKNNSDIQALVKACLDDSSLFSFINSFIKARSE